MRTVFYLGTRPELIKTYSVIREFQVLTASRPGWNVKTVFTGQHTDLMAAAATDLDVHVDDWLDAPPVERTLADLVAHMLVTTTRSMTAIQPDCVVIHGDTASALTAGLSAEFLRVPVVHIEAGVRAPNREEPFPEDLNRRLISQLADYHVCFNTATFECLIREGVSSRHIVLGAHPLVEHVSRIIDPDGVGRSNHIVITTHRRERRGERLGAIVDLVGRLRARLPELEVHFVWHPALESVSGVRESLQRAGAIVRDAMPPSEFIRFVATAAAVVTDSAGTAEEASILGVPVVSFRNSSEIRFEPGHPAGLVSEQAEAAIEYVCAGVASGRSTQRLKPFEALPASDGIAAAIARFVVDHYQGEISTLHSPEWSRASVSTTLDI